MSGGKAVIPRKGTADEGSGILGVFLKTVRTPAWLVVLEYVVGSMVGGEAFEEDW